MGTKILLLCMLLVIPVVFSERDVDYCRIQSCDPGKHTMCLFDKPEPASMCGSQVDFGLSDTDRNIILDMHNEIRENVYRGLETRGRTGPQPAAARITRLEWDYELEDIAERWALQCQIVTDTCRNVLRFKVNQNVGEDKSHVSPNRLSVKNIIKKWHNEVALLDHEEISHFREYYALFLGTNHYTQMVWESTIYIGCSTIRYNDGRFYKLGLVCNYGPAGNINGKRVYKIKPPEN